MCIKTNQLPHSDAGFEKGLTFFLIFKSLTNAVKRAAGAYRSGRLTLGTLVTFDSARHVGIETSRARSAVGLDSVPVNSVVRADRARSCTP
jgi:hypothetical protein